MRDEPANAGAHQEPTAEPSRSRASRRVVWIVTAASVLAVGVAGVALTRGGPDDAAATAQPTNGMGRMQDMQDMPGMAMGGDGAVRLTADQVRQFGVTFGTVEERVLTAAVRTAGVVAVDERRLATVAPRFAGFVERLLVETTGERVGRGQALAEVYAPEVLATQEELLVARRLGNTLGSSAVPGVASPTSDLVAAARRRLLLMGVGAGEIDAVLRTGRARRTVTLRAPASGVVLEKRVVQGQAVAAGEPLYTIADLSTVWVEAELREADAASVREGSAADVELAAYPGRALKGTVAYVYPTLDAATRTLRARVVVANAEGRLRPGMFATVRVSTPTRRALTVPATAVIRTGERSVVFVDMGAGRLMPHDVETDRASGEFVEVLAGLEPGQRVVTSAQYLLESESNLADVMRAMMGQMGSTDMGGMQDMGGMPGMEGMPAMPGMDAKGADTRGLPRAAAPAPGTTPGPTPTPRR